MWKTFSVFKFDTDSVRKEKNIEAQQAKESCTCHVLCAQQNIVVFSNAIWKHAWREISSKHLLGVFDWLRIDILFINFAVHLEAFLLKEAFYIKDIKQITTKINILRSVDIVLFKFVS